ncbi:hypothetical protein M2310_000112 [Rhizobium leguminosarum]|uniref:Uncharacterized protein n=1 Tax=Rhizobium esperanzae TaxID=1967781 RepID=A0A7W6XT57_9HYPH|nr:hypothetical protein [Rhizobium leguminosarum]MBB4436882.1 hypothetical protein [Rhizobium esperanzae]MDH6199459.1 hypothetical protein [Rhizobium leguminosarum]
MPHYSGRRARSFSSPPVFRVISFGLSEKIAGGSTLESEFTRDHQLIEKIGGVIIASRGTIRTWSERMTASCDFSRALFSAENDTSEIVTAIMAADAKETVRAHRIASSDIAPTVASRPGHYSTSDFPKIGKASLPDLSAWLGIGFVEEKPAHFPLRSLATHIPNALSEPFPPAGICDQIGLERRHDQRPLV